jgi:hypothetical protein
MLKVTFSYYSNLLKKSFLNVELHRSMEDAKYRAICLGWTIKSVEAA